MAHRYVYRKNDNEEITWLEGTWPLDLRNAGKSILRFDLDGVTLVFKIPSQQGVFENPHDRWYECGDMRSTSGCYRDGVTLAMEKSTMMRWYHSNDLHSISRRYQDIITTSIENPPQQDGITLVI